MINSIYDYSIRKKLIFFLSLSAAIALFISTTTTLVYYYFDDKNRVIDDNIKLAKVSGKNIAASLMFLDEESINTILKPILNDKNVKYIKVYDESGKLFTAIGDSIIHQNNWTKNNFSNNKEVDIFVDWHYINILTSIPHANENVGFLEITTSTDGIKNRILEQMIVSLVIVIITISIILFLAFLLEKMFSKPIFDLLSAIKTLRESNEYNINLVPYTKDEFGELFVEFNIMVNEIDKRDQILKEHNLDLKLLVNTTTKELKTTQDDLHKASILATTDVLTNLSNRRDIMDKFDEMIIDAQTNQKNLGVIMLDIDHFKSVNDNFGHHAGDVVLREVATILQENARENDFVGRIGGEEFLVLCKESDTKRTFDVAERLRKKVESKVITYEEGKTTQVKISLGIYSSIPKLEKEDLMKIADEALYISKETGRNRVSIGVER